MSHTGQPVNLVMRGAGQVIVRAQRRESLTGPWAQGRLPREAATGEGGVCDVIWAWEDHGKMQSSYGCDECEGPGGQPLGSIVTK